MASSLSVPSARTSGYGVPDRLVELYRSPSYQETYNAAKNSGFDWLNVGPNGLEMPAVSSDAVDLMEAFVENWPARHQGTRGTCTGFCTSACVELIQARATGTMTQFSPEFIYHYLREETAKLGTDAVPEFELGAAKLSLAPAVLEAHGICLEDTMRYDFALPVPQTLAPDPTTIQSAMSYRHVDVYTDDFGTQHLQAPCDADTPEIILAQLKSGYPVAIGVPVFAMNDSVADNWDSRFALRSGIIRSPYDDPNNVSLTPVSGHAVCIVGFQPAPAERGGGWFIFRNSWAEKFATHPSGGYDGYPKVPAKGFGAISAHYLRCFTIEFTSFKSLL